MEGRVCTYIHKSGVYVRCVKVLTLISMREHTLRHTLTPKYMVRLTPIPTTTIILLLLLLLLRPSTLSLSHQVLSLSSFLSLYLSFFIHSLRHRLLREYCVVSVTAWGPLTT